MEPVAQNAQGTGIAQALGANASASVTITGYTAEQVQMLIRTAGEAQQAAIGDLSRQLNTTREAVLGFLKILDANEVPTEKLPEMLAQVAQRHRAMLQRLSALDSDAPETKAYIEEARKVLSTAASAADYDRADSLLAEAQGSEMQAIREAEALEQEAKQAASRKRRSAAATRAERGELARTRLDYLQAGQHFKAAADLIGDYYPELRAKYLNSYAGALRQFGYERGDNTVLAQAIGVCRMTLQEITRERVPLDWAQTQDNLGNALRSLGERESGTGRLEEAVKAYREALQERTRERVPLDWAQTQNNLGNALWRLGERESGTGRLEEAVDHS